MDLKSIISKNTGKDEKFWAIVLQSEWISCAVWEVFQGEVNIISSTFDTKWDKEVKSLTETVDDCLSSCVASLPEDFEDPEKVVFGLPYSWINEGNIKEEYLLQLKEVCDELSLKPSGFVVLGEAIAHYIKSIEGSPLSAIIVHVQESSLDISLFNSGRPSGNFSIIRSVSISDDLVEGLARFSGYDVFPSRIILFNGKKHDLEDLRSVLSETSWTETDKFKFLHPPKIDVIDSLEKIKAVCLAGGSEIADALKLVDKDEKIPEEISNISSEISEGISAKDLGFEVEDGSVEKPDRAHHLPDLPKITAPKISLPKLRFSKPTINSQPFIIGIVAICTFFVAGFLFWWFYPEAKVTIYVSPKKIEGNFDLKIDEIKSRELKTSVSGEKTKPTTGTKVVGEKAKGSVKIQNGTSNPVNLKIGTRIVSSLGLEFETEKPASVSAALSPSSPGVATVDVIASNIGSEYNLVKDEMFKVANYPKADVDAQSTDNFSGGSSRQISAVSQEDLDVLSGDLGEELMTNVLDQLKDDVSLEELLVLESAKKEIKNSDFSNKIGDEAGTIKLNLEMDISIRAFSKDELFSKAESLFDSKVPQGFFLRADQITYIFSKGDEEDIFSVAVLANLLPGIDVEEVAKIITGKSTSIAEQHLSNISGFENAEFKFNINLPGQLGTLPHVTKKIQIEVSANK